MTINHLMDTAIKATLVAGEKIMEVYASVDFDISLKDDSSPLTLADRQAHLAIVNILQPTQIPVLSEEGIHLSFAERSPWKTFWLVDPLDGTKEFIQRNDEFTVNIALVDSNKSIAGVIYCPVFKALYVGIVGSGAWKIQSPQADCTLDWVVQNGLKLPFENAKSDYTIAVSRSHLDDRTLAWMEDVKKLHPHLKVIKTGSSLKFCLLAEGTADSYARFGPTMEWDTAAGHAIVKAVGKNIYLTDQQTEIHYNKENLLNPYFIAL